MNDVKNNFLYDRDTINVSKCSWSRGRNLRSFTVKIDLSCKFKFSCNNFSKDPVTERTENCRSSSQPFEVTDKGLFKAKSPFLKHFDEISFNNAKLPQSVYLYNFCIPMHFGSTYFGFHA